MFRPHCKGDANDDGDDNDYDDVNNGNGVDYVEWHKHAFVVSWSHHGLKRTLYY